MASADSASTETGDSELNVEVANRHYRRTEAEIRSFVESALRECTLPGGELNGQALFLQLLDGFLMDKFQELGASLQGRPPSPRALVQAQLVAMDRCHEANPFCFESSEHFARFRAMVEQNLNPDLFYQENIAKYNAAAR